MNFITISEEAYIEFKSFLEANDIKDLSIRINYAGSACSGPVFNISPETAKDGDILEKINDITFISDKDVIDEFGGFVLLSTEENDGRGMSLRPLLEPEGSGCGTCAGCH